MPAGPLDADLGDDAARCHFDGEQHRTAQAAALRDQRIGRRRAVPGQRQRGGVRDRRAERRRLRRGVAACSGTHGERARAQEARARGLLRGRGEGGPSQGVEARRARSSSRRQEHLVEGRSVDGGGARSSGFGDLEGLQDRLVERGRLDLVEDRHGVGGEGPGGPGLDPRLDDLLGGPVEVDRDVQGEDEGRDRRAVDRQGDREARSTLTTAGGAAGGVRGGGGAEDRERHGVVTVQRNDRVSVRPMPEILLDS